MMAVQVGGQSQNWELSLYELHRTPQEVIVDETKLSVSARLLHNDLMCPICLDMLKNTMTTKECLHRFCSECIVTALRSGNKECPTCRKKLVSRRSLRRDLNFDALISKIYPSRDEYDAHQRNMMERINKANNKQALSSSIEEGLRQQARCRSERSHRVKKATQESDNTTFSGCEDNGDSRSHFSHDSAPSNSLLPQGRTPPGAGPSRKRRRASEDGSVVEFDSESPTPSRIRCLDAIMWEIEMVFRPHPQLVQGQDYNQTRFVKTTANATVDHLSKYLALRIALQNGEEPEVREREEGKAEESAADGGSETRGTSRGEEGNSPSHINEKMYTIYIKTKRGQFLTLNGSLTLELVNEKYWKVLKPLELYYALTKDQPQQHECPPPPKEA